MLVVYKSNKKKFQNISLPIKLWKIEILWIAMPIHILNYVIYIDLDVTFAFFIVWYAVFLF